MQFSSEGYIIKLRNHGEKSLIATIVCPDRGKIVGYINGARSKKGLGTYQLGNKISFNAYARVEENMLSLKGVELVKSHAVDFMLDAAKTEALSSLCTLLDQCVAENDNLGHFYKITEDFFEHINSKNWLVYYSFFEFYLLDFLGIGLDINSCAVTGKTFDLQYISPKTGRAVCGQIGAPYKDKLFSYPHYIAEKNYLPNGAEIADLLKMTGSFLHKNFLQIHNLHLPEKRANLLEVNKLYQKI
jgi:DNA repair protein RecO (recombination protein O)